MSKEKPKPSSSKSNTPTGITKTTLGKVQGGRTNPTFSKPPPPKKK